MKITILGGGFGIYGYLPALLQIPNSTVILPSRYKARLKSRDDISQFYDVINWMSDDEDLLKNCEGVIIALPPTEQYRVAKECMNYKNINYMFLEKPLASSPALAKDLLKDLESSGKKFRLGYNFRYTDWGKAALQNQRGIESVSWNFRANHYTQNLQTWKRQHNEGGGALRFYGIHLIALLAELGYSHVVSSEIGRTQESEAETWNAELTGTNLSLCNIHISTNTHNPEFSVRDSEGNVYSLSQPFQTMIRQEENIMDQRIPFLTECLSDLFFKDQLCYNWYNKANMLWTNIEKRTQIS